MEQFARPRPSPELRVCSEAEEAAGQSSTFPARAMLRALPLLRPLRPLGARGCTSDGAAGGHEIQVRALAGSDRGKSSVSGRAHEAAGLDQA